MKLILEEETTETIDNEEVKTIKKVKDVKDVSEALALKDVKKKQFIHQCYHDEENPRSCRRIQI